MLGVQFLERCASLFRLSLVLMGMDPAVGIALMDAGVQCPPGCSVYRVFARHYTCGERFVAYRKAQRVAVLGQCASANLEHLVFEIHTGPIAASTFDAKPSSANTKGYSNDGTSNMADNEEYLFLFKSRLR